MHRHAAGDRLDLGDGGLGSGVEVGLRQHDHGPRTALPREDQVALEPAQAQVLVHRGDEKRHVDVRGQHLLLGRLPGGLPRELREPRQDGRDRAHGRAGVGPGGDDDPVADHGQVGVRRRLVDEAAWYLAAELAELGEHVVGTAMLNRDPAGDDVVAGEGLVQGAQPVVPAERFEFGQAKTPFGPRVHESGARDCAPVGEVRTGGRSEFRLTDGPRDARGGGSDDSHLQQPPRVGGGGFRSRKRIGDSGRTKAVSYQRARLRPRGGPRRGRRSATDARGGRRRHRAPRPGARAASPKPPTG